MKGLPSKNSGSACHGTSQPLRCQGPLVFPSFAYEVGCKYISASWLWGRCVPGSAKSHTSTKGRQLASWWDSEFISRVPEFPQGLLFKGKLVCLQLDPWATFDSCSKNNKTDGQNRFWGLHPNCHPQWNLKKAWNWWGSCCYLSLCSAFNIPEP